MAHVIKHKKPGPPRVEHILHPEPGVSLDELLEDISADKEKYDVIKDESHNCVVVKGKGLED